MSTIRITSPDDIRTMQAGPGKPTRVMALIGNSSRGSTPSQILKLDALRAMTNGPDAVADLSITRTTPELIPEIVDRGFIASALPIYGVRKRSGAIDPVELLDRCRTAVGLGARMLTIHPTPTAHLIASAQQRLVPWTSRGGGIIIRDLVMSGSTDNVYQKILPSLIELALSHGVALSLGASFRSANIFDSYDLTQQAEIASQIALADELHREGVMVVIESPGHASPRSITEVSRRLAASRYPIMPLGPIPTDTAIGQDHISSAIGATLMGLAGAAHILAAVTREEHTGGVPTSASTIEAVEAARVAAHIIDLGNGTANAVSADYEIARARSESKTCVVERSKPGCARCADACPLIVDPREIAGPSARK
ncbi:phosphomethylpyrimidine synthase ThiC [Agreia sp. VKM Ac-1783]|uniref:phosphomethylpyrimidine synthase ThiC n=1 Tax=Agreia sp. VKM Ac-1783 TaxID=1938889 RepID=UPI0026CE7C81